MKEHGSFFLDTRPTRPETTPTPFLASGTSERVSTSWGELRVVYTKKPCVEIAILTC